MILELLCTGLKSDGESKAFLYFLILFIDYFLIPPRGDV